MHTGIPFQAVAFYQEHQDFLWIAGMLSILTFLVGIVLVPLIILWLPADYFNRAHRTDRPQPPRHPVLRILMLVLKNTVGILLVVAGLIMLVIPGQGILTLLIGVSLLDFPGKYQLEKRMVRIPAVAQSINWIRTRAGRPPMQPSR